MQAMFDNFSDLEFKSFDINEWLKQLETVMHRWFRYFDTLMVFISTRLFFAKVGTLNPTLIALLYNYNITII